MESITLMGRFLCFYCCVSISWSRSDYNLSDLTFERASLSAGGVAVTPWGCLSLWLCMASDWELSTGFPFHCRASRPFGMSDFLRRTELGGVFW